MKTLNVAGKPVVAHFDELRHPNYALFFYPMNWQEKKDYELCGLLTSWPVKDVIFHLGAKNVYFLIDHEDTKERMCCGYMDHDEFEHFLNFFCGMGEKASWLEEGF